MKLHVADVRIGGEKAEKGSVERMGEKGLQRQGERRICTDVKS